MPWVRIDDHFDEHPKLAKVGPLGWALWLAGLAYSNRNLLDGFIPWAIAQRLVCWDYLEPPDEEGRRKQMTISVTSGMAGDDVETDRVIALLVWARLWEPVDGGFHIHDYDDYQLTKAEIQQISEAKRRAGQAGGQASAQARAERPVKQAPGSRPSRAVAEPNPKPKPNPDPSRSTASTTAGVLVDEKYGAFCTLYANNVGTLGPLIASRLAELADEYSLEWFEAGVKESVESGAHSLKHIDAILERWKRDGFRSPLPSPGGRGRSTAASGRRPAKELRTAEELKVGWEKK